MPGPDHVQVKLADGVNVGAIVTMVFVQDIVCAVPVPATLVPVPATLVSATPVSATLVKKETTEEQMDWLTISDRDI